MLRQKVQRGRASLFRIHGIVLFVTRFQFLDVSMQYLGWIISCGRLLEWGQTRNGRVLCESSVTRWTRQKLFLFQNLPASMAFVIFSKMGAQGLIRRPLSLCTAVKKGECCEGCVLMAATECPLLPSCTCAYVPFWPCGAYPLWCDIFEPTTWWINLLQKWI